MKGLVLLAVLLFAVTCHSLQLKTRSKQHPLRKIIDGAGSSVVTVDEAAVAFDFYMLVLQWDAKVSTSYFTIHGLWPENKDGSYPSDCAGPKFNLSTINSLVTSLNKVWPSNNGANSVFWQHEWEKHGTCSEFEQYAYFSNSINLQGLYNVKTALDRANIIPTATKTYTTTSINNAVQSYIGALPALHCSSSKLVEIALCITKSLSLTNCPTSMGSYFKCPASVTYN